MNSLKAIIVSLLAVCTGQISATHIVGGEMTYQYQGNNKYKINLSVFIDCINGQPGAIEQDATAVIGVYDGVNGRILNGYPVIVGRNGPLRVTKVNYNCISTTPNACVDHYWYETTLTLPPRTGGYYVSFQRCCRNNSISNLVNPGGTGANYWTLIPDPRTLPDGKPNSSAVFKELPPNFLCTNTILKFDHSAKDADGDSLVYDLFLPFRGATQNAPRPDNNGSGTLASPPFPNITFGSSYDELNPIDGNPPLTIDPETGFLSLVPTVEGQFVVGIRVREYRKGVLIGETKRDYQFNVRSCVIDMVAAYFSPKYICGYSYKFQNKSQGATRYHWDFGIAGTDSDTSNQYQPTAIFPAAGKYRVVLTTYKNNCIDSFAQDVFVVEPSKPKLPKDTMICPASTAQYFSDITAESYRWSTGATTRGIVVRKEGKYWLEITIKTCKWRDTVEVKEDKDSIQAFGDTVYCTYDTFRRRLFASPGLFKYSWSNGSKLDRTFVTSQGQYVVSAVTALGCASSDTATVEHYPPVEVVVPDTTICPYNSVRFDAKNPGATIEWSNGDLGRYSTITTPNTYRVKVTIGKCRDFDTFTLSNYPFEFALGNDLRFCSTIDTPLTVDGSKFSNVVWNKEVTGPKFRLLNPGKLVVHVTNQYGCPESDSINVQLFPNPGLDLGKDTLLCLSINPVLDAGANLLSYRWHDGKTERFYTAYEPGLYWVEVKSDDGCLSRDSVRINKSPDVFPSLVYMPNAFTPDGNGINDLFPDNKYVNIGTMYSVKLYNRWGEKIADYQTPEVNWDGSIGGKPAPEGVYVFLVTWIGCDNIRRTMRGDFHLLR